MNKYACLVFIVIFTCASLVGGAILVTSPKPGQDFEKGTKLDIKWTSPGCSGPAVKINIFRNSINQANFVLQLTGPNKGSKSWFIPGNFATGKYILRVKTDEKGCLGDSGIFDIIDKKGPIIGIIQAEALKLPPKQKTSTHRAPAIGQPSNASFNIKTIQYGVNKNGRIDAMWVVVGYNSKTPFSFSKYQGHSKDGPAYMNCKITIPVWPNDPNYKGPFKTKVIFNQRLSVIYRGQNNLKCEPGILNAGTGVFELIFSPAHSGKVEGLWTKQRMPNSNPWQGHDNWCTKRYLPKMALRLFIHTKEGVKQAYKEFYLQRGPKVKSITIPGEVTMCSSGNVYW